MRPIRTSAVALLLLSGLAAQQAQQAQQATTSNNPPPAPRPDRTVSVDFRGGNLAEYVAALRSAGKNVNIVVPEAASRVHIPPIVLRDTSVEAALRSATQVAEGGMSISLDMSLGTLPNVGPIGEPVYAIRVRPIPEANPYGSNASQQAVRVFSLRGLTKPPTDASKDAAMIDVKTILTAIDTGLEVAATQEEQTTGSSDKAVLRLHEDSGLLFVAGNMTQLRLIDEVLNCLERELKAARKNVATTETAPDASTKPEKTDKAQTTGERRDAR